MFRSTGLGLAVAAALTMAAPPTTDPASYLPDPIDVADVGGVPIEVAGPPSCAATAGGSVWIAVDDEVLRLDATTGETLGASALPGVVCNGMGDGEASLWVGTCFDPIITRIDTATGEVAEEIDLGTPTGLRDNSSVSVGEGSVWAVTSGNDPLLVRIDPATDAVVGRYPISVGSAAVQAGLGGVWVSNCEEEIVLRYDPETGDRVATIDVGYYPDALAIGEGSVWVINEEDGSVSRIDPATNTAIATVVVSPKGIDGDLVVAGGSVWVRVNDVLLVQIDAGTNEVVARYGPGAGHGSVTADNDAVWVTGDDPSSVWRLALPIQEH